MEETIIFRQTPDSTLQRAVVAVNNTTGCDVIYKVEANVSRKLIRIKPATGFIPVNDKAEVEILRRWDGALESPMKVTVSYTPAQSKIKDLSVMWANAPSNMIISKALTCVMDEGKTTQNYHRQDIRVGNDPRERPVTDRTSTNNSSQCTPATQNVQTQRSLMLNRMPIDGDSK